MSITPSASGGNNLPGPPTGAPPAVIFTIAAACGAVTTYFTTWDTGATVFLAVISLFKPERQ